MVNDDLSEDEDTSSLKKKSRFVRKENFDSNNDLNGRKPTHSSGSQETPSARNPLVNDNELHYAESSDEESSDVQDANEADSVETAESTKGNKTKVEYLGVLSGEATSDEFHLNTEDENYVSVNSCPEKQ